MPVAPCPVPCPPVVTGIVIFSPTEFVGLWPEFTGITNGAMQNAFNEAIYLCDNSCGSIVHDAQKRLVLLYLLTAHLLFLNVGTNDGQGNVTPPQGIVGRIANATEGSVSVAAEYSSNVTQSEAFFIQTKYGAQFWQLTAQARTFRYAGAPLSGPNGPAYPFGWGGLAEVQ